MGGEPGLLNIIAGEIRFIARRESIVMGDQHRAGSCLLSTRVLPWKCEQALGQCLTWSISFFGRKAVLRPSSIPNIMELWRNLEDFVLE